MKLTAVSSAGPSGLGMAGIAMLGCLAAGCRQTAEPSSFAPPYVAVVTKFDAAPGVDVGHYSYRIRELSGTLGVDTTVVPSSPTDTIIVSVPNVTATYVVSLSGVPAKCISRNGNEAQFIVPEGTNTTIVRYFIICKPLVTLYMSTEGAARDTEYLFRLSGNGIERVGRLSEQDTVVVEDVPPGDYRFDLAGIADNCTAISQGLREPRITVPDQGGARLDLRVACSDPARRPTIVSMAATYADGVNGLSFVAADPDRDMDWYQWDITDCQGIPSSREVSGLGAASSRLAAMPTRFASASRSISRRNCPTSPPAARRSGSGISSATPRRSLRSPFGPTILPRR